MKCPKCGISLVCVAGDDLKKTENELSLGQTGYCPLYEEWYEWAEVYQFKQIEDVKQC